MFRRPGAVWLQPSVPPDSFSERYFDKRCHLNARIRPALHYVAERPAPQQEPGPAHPASAGRRPQQPWSFGPGTVRRPLPVRGLVGDISFSG